jgi:hypothetical protein
MEINWLTLGILVDKPSNRANRLFAMINTSSVSASISIGGFGGNGRGMKERYVKSPDKLVFHVPDLLSIIIPPNQT